MTLNAARADSVTQENKMKKIIYILGIVGLIGGGCHTSKNIQKSVTAKPEINQSPVNLKKPVDSVTILKEQLSTLLHTPANFTTFYGKAKADFNSPQASGNVTVYIRMLKDSLIWISITGPLNIEGARVLITQDSLKIINKLEGSVQLSSIAHLQQITRLPFTFSDFQNIIIGKPTVPDAAQLNYEFKKDSIKINAADVLIKYFFSFTKNNLHLGQSRLQSATGSTEIDANIFYNGYHLVDAINFSAERDIAVQGTSPMNLQLDFKEYNFNQPQTFPFTISKNYSIKYD
jgi:hypothetical protein